MSYGVKFVLKLVLLSRLFQSLRSFLPKDGGHLGKNVLVFIVSQAAEDAFSLIWSKWEWRGQIEEGSVRRWKLEESSRHSCRNVIWHTACALVNRLLYLVCKKKKKKLAFGFQFWLLNVKHSVWTEEYFFFVFFYHRSYIFTVSAKEKLKKPGAQSNMKTSHPPSQAKTNETNPDIRNRRTTQRKQIKIYIFLKSVCWGYSLLRLSGKGKWEESCRQREGRRERFCLLTRGLQSQLNTDRQGFTHPFSPQLPPSWFVFGLLTV